MDEGDKKDPSATQLKLSKRQVHRLMATLSMDESQPVIALDHQGNIGTSKPSIHSQNNFASINNIPYRVKRLSLSSKSGSFHLGSVSSCIVNTGATDLISSSLEPFE